MLRLSTRDDFADLRDNPKKVNVFLDGLSLTLFNSTAEFLRIPPIDNVDQLSEEEQKHIRMLSNSVLNFLVGDE